MIGDEVYRHCVTSLWALIGSVRLDPGAASADARRALSDALAAVHAALGTERFLMLQEVGGVLHVNGHMLPMSVDVFAAANGIATLFREHSVGEVMFDEAIDEPALLCWAGAQAAASRGGKDGPMAPFGNLLGTAGVTTSLRDVDRPVPLERHAVADEAPDSRLRSIFLQHHLIVALGSSSWMPPHQAKVAIAGVVDRMLGLAGGMEPLMLLQRDDVLLYRSLHVAVLAVAFARVAGWPDERLPDLGGAALLHDVGAAIDPDRPGPAGTGWLLERGLDEFWLLSAVVAGAWRRPHGSSLADLGPNDSLAAAIVRVAAIVERISGAAPSSAAVRDGLRAAAADGTVPIELVEVGLATLAQWQAVA